MPEPFLGLCVCGYLSAAAFIKRDNAVSDEAHAVRHAAVTVMELVESSQALFGAKATAMSALDRLYAECKTDDWDGDGSLAVSETAIARAKEFLRFLPDTLPLPEFAVEPDGSVSLDWMESRLRVFSVSINSGQRIAYAWIDGSSKGHGVETFNTDIPQRILDGIASIVNEPSLRAA